MNSNRLILITALLLGTASACAEPVTPVQPQKSELVAPAAAPTTAMQWRQLLQQEKAKIIKLVGEAKADTAKQCRLLALGQKACGGPESYLAYSISETDEKLLKQHAFMYKQLQQQMQAQSGLLSNCAVVPEARLEWSAGHCRLSGANSF
ncbi:hypothetical protein [Rheinheimera faecalis]